MTLVSKSYYIYLSVDDKMSYEGSIFFYNGETMSLGVLKNISTAAERCHLRFLCL